MSESYARAICEWSDKIPEDCRPAADAILVAAARAGAALEDLAQLAAEIYVRSRPDSPDDGPGDSFGDRCLRLETTMDGVGVLTADLLSGPGGLASFLRRHELGARLAGPSLPLDVGYSHSPPARAG